MNGWESTTLDDLYAEPSRNGLTRPKSVRGSGYRMINMGEIFAHERIGNIEMERVQMTEKEIASFEVKKGDLLFARQSLVLAGAGKCSLVKFVGETTTFESHLIRVRLNPKRAVPDFFFYYFISPQGKQNVQSIVMQVAAAGIRGSELAKLEVPIPPLPVQRRIAGILSAYDELMENSQRRIGLLEAMARALYREWFVHFRFPGHEKHPRVASPLGDIPQGWEVKPFTEIADVLSGGTPKTDVAEYWDGEIPFFTPRDVPDCFYVQDTDKHTNELGLSKCASELYPPDTVFITARGTVGKVALPSVPMAMNQSCYALRGKPGIPQRFLFLMTLQQVDYLKTNTGGATFDTIVVDTFRRMEVVKPARDIIARFAKKTDAIFEQVNTLQRQIQNLRRTRDLLLPRLLSGQVELKTQAA